MAIVKEEIRDRIRAIFEHERTQTDNQEASIERIYTALAGIIADVAVEAVNTAVVTNTPVLIAPPTGGAVTGTITTTLKATTV